MDFKAQFFAKSGSQGIAVDAFLTDQDLKFQIPEVGQMNWPVSEIKLHFLAGSKKLILARLDSDYPSLFINDEGESALLSRNWPVQKNIPSSGNFSLIKPMFGLIFLVILIVGFLFFFWKFNPFLSDFLADRIPVEWELKTGDQMFESLMKTEKIDSLKTGQIREFYSRLKPLSVQGQKTQRPISLTVVSNPEFNAFAMPGRHIVIYSGVFNRVQSPGQLMALIGHESGHVENRHSIRSLVRASALYAIVSLVFGDFTGLSAILVDNAQSIQNLSYSREFEREADLESHRFLCQNNVNPKGVLELMEILNKIGKPHEEKGLSFFQSHPQTGERMESARKQLKENPCVQMGNDSLELNEIFNQIKQGAGPSNL